MCTEKAGAYGHLPSLLALRQHSWHPLQQQPLDSAWGRIGVAEEMGVGEEKGSVLAGGEGAGRRGRGTTPCPQRESLAAGGHPAWADSPGKAGTRAWSRSSPPSAPASPHGNQAQHIRAVRGGRLHMPSAVPHPACFCRSTGTHTHGDPRRLTGTYRGQNSAAWPLGCDRQVRAPVASQEGTLRALGTVG